MPSTVPNDFGLNYESKYTKILKRDFGGVHQFIKRQFIPENWFKNEHIHLKLANTHAFKQRSYLMYTGIGGIDKSGRSDKVKSGHY